MKTVRLELVNDRAADLAMELALRERLFTSMRRGRFWHRVPFSDLAQLREYLREHQRFVHRATWVVDEETRRRHADEPFVIRRAVRFEVLKASRDR